MRAFYRCRLFRDGGIPWSCRRWGRTNRRRRNTRFVRSIHRTVGFQKEPLCDRILPP